MSDHHSVAIPTECFLQESSQLAVPVVHIPKRGGGVVITITITINSFDDNDIIVHIPKRGGGGGYSYGVNDITVHVSKRDDGKVGYEVGWKNTWSFSQQGH